MSKVFEDEFMELQSDLISLCLELTGGNVDVIYAYASIEEKSHEFNAFFQKDRKVLTTDLINVENDLIFQFLDAGIDDLNKVRTLCECYGKPRPTEMKMVYNTKTGEYHADFKYKPVCNIRKGISGYTVFNDWVSEIEAKMQKV